MFGKKMPTVINLIPRERNEKKRMIFSSIVVQRNLIMLKIYRGQSYV